jgi:hypothetical protein
MSLWARSRWTWARASAPVIHFDSPEGSAILPSIDKASFKVMRGRPSLSRVSQPAIDPRRRVRAAADVDPDACLAEAGRRPDRRSADRGPRER